MSNTERRTHRTQAKRAASPVESGDATARGAERPLYIPPRLIVEDLDALTAALEYAKDGWYIAPVRSGSKHPGSILGAEWQSKTSRDPEQLIAWFAGTNHGIALHLGRSGAVAFDIDNPAYLPWALQDAIIDAENDCNLKFQLTRHEAPEPLDDDDLKARYSQEVLDDPQFLASMEDMRWGYRRGHALFRLPPGRMVGNSKGTLTGPWGEVRGRNGVIIAQPTVHADAANGGRYRWLDCGPLPLLPAALDAALPDATGTVDAATDAETTTFLEQHTGNARPDLLASRIKSLRGKIAAGESRHAMTCPYTIGAMAEARAGYYPARQAAAQIREFFVEAMAVPREGSDRKLGARAASAEFNGILSWAVGQALAADLDAVHKRVAKLGPTKPLDDPLELITGPPGEDGLTVDPRTGEVLETPAPPAGPPTLEEAVRAFPWEERGSLKCIRDFARARRAAPFAVLGDVLARVSAVTPVEFVLPPLVGGIAGLNVFVANVATSGHGKGAALAAAKAVAPFDDWRDPISEGPLRKVKVGSGEGVAHQYAHYEKGIKGAPGEVVRHRTAVLFDVPEVDILTGLSQRQGATLSGVLREVFSGEDPGFGGYVDPLKALPLKEHTYRAALVLGVQPERAGKLFTDADGGLPQRFLFMPTIDTDRPAQRPAQPEPLTVAIPEPRQRGKQQEITVCAEVVQAVDEHSANMLDGVDMDPLDGHAVLLQEKVAALLAALEGHLGTDGITSDDWRIAGALMAVSNAVRAGVQDVLRRGAAQVNLARGKAEADRDAIKTDAMEQRGIARCGDRLVDKLGELPRGQWLSGSDLKKAVGKRHRPYFEDAISQRLAVGEIEAKTVEYRGNTGTHYRRRP